ncbi:SRPBCC family protein, partial [Immundisolibacter sp.]
GTHLYATRANWKMLPVNVIDGNHFMPTHVTYLQYLRERGSEMKEPIRDFHEAHLGNGHTVFEYEAPWGRPQGKPDPAWSDAVNGQILARREELLARLGPELGDRIARRNRNLVIFPNLIINDIMGTTIRVAEPVSVDYMEITAWQFCPADDPPELARVRNEQFLTFLGPGGFATPDDTEGMEASQRGFACYREAPWVNYSKGIAAELAGGYTRPGESDFMMRAFFNAWQEYLGIDRFAEAS